MASSAPVLPPTKRPRTEDEAVVHGFGARGVEVPVREPEVRILVYDVSKKANIGTIMRSAVAFGVREIVVAGGVKLQSFGNQGTHKYVRTVTFRRLEYAVDYLKRDGFEIVGVEIDDGAVDVATRPFRGRTAFVFGNEGQGMNEAARRVCERLVYIRQVGLGTASLNVAVAAGIVLHHFCEWAHYEEAQRHGQKFVVARGDGEAEAEATVAGQTDSPKGPSSPANEANEVQSEPNS